jgi:hypothetical protein
MPPRFAYWTILIDGKPTAFRARDRQELLPTANQLKRTNKDVLLRWFARGRLWESPQHEQEARRRKPRAQETRGPDWRPGGTHKDPRARFAKRKAAAHHDRRRKRRPQRQPPGEPRKESREEPED